MHTLTPDTLDALLDAAWVGDRVALRAYLTTYLAEVPPEEHSRRQRWEARLAQEDRPTRGAALGRYRYAGQVVEAYDANDVRGMVLPVAGPFPEAILRIAEPGQPRAFHDYTWHHCDLSVRLECNEDATLYVGADGQRYLDHAPATLGLEAVP